MTKWLVQMKPQSLDNIIAMVALFRPGPMEFIPDYISRMHGETEVIYRHPAMEPIFCDTYGIPIYQEQIMRAAVELAGYTPSEADDLRKAISKKKKDDLEKHSRKFTQGAMAKGIEQATAEGIFADWQEFARYGFNKSHAADYGVLAVQNGFLKLRYPVEYMTALLSATKNETEKMALYVNDARNMGVMVLPPDINASHWDFAIEEAEGKSVIRFGMGAVKNTGQGAVDLLVQSRRKGGAFKDLNDLAARVDLRAVGKRALESLIKVGALDKLGSRTALLEALDRIVAVSSSHFRAAEAGQLSLFGGDSGVSDAIHLPLVPDADRRETLNWERELIGMYISEHPLTPYLDEIKRIVTHFSANLSEAADQEKTRVAGMVSNIRPYQTKTGKMMAWVMLEDVAGTIELVLFPRTWEKFQFDIAVGGIIIAEGRVDAGSNPSKVLVENIRTEIRVTEPAQLALHPQVSAPQRKPGTQTSGQISESTSAYKKNPVPRPIINPQADPPPPEDPPDWEEFSKGSQVLPTTESSLDKSEKLVEIPEVQVRSPSVIHPIEENPAPPAPVLLRSIPVPPKRVEGDQAPKMLTVTLRPTGDGERDMRRISRLYGTLISFPGKDRFAFQIFEEGRGHLIEFPNDSTHVSPEMLIMIKDAVGEENILVEPILYQ
jgi:DNA polymerase-3 subunit alpha